jgi:MFS family permease
MARYWFAVIPILILCYYGAYLLAFRGDLPKRAAMLVMLLMSLGFLAIAFFYTNNMSLMLRPDVFAAWYRDSGRGVHLNSGDATVWPRYLHFLLGAASVAGLVVAWVGAVRRRRDPEFGRWAVRYGSAWCLVATLLNFIVGLWWLGAMPRELLLGFLTGRTLGSIALGIGIAAGLAVLVLLAISTFHPEPFRFLHLASTAMLVTLAGMILARDQVREETLTHHGFALNPWVAPQWGPIAIFAVLLVVAIVLVVWMAVALARGNRSRTA